MDNYYIYFISLFIFIYTFGFYWIFIDLWKYSRIEILVEGINPNENQKISRDLENIISILKMKNFKIISFINFFVFITLNLLNLLIALLIFYEIMPGVAINLPGTYIENSEPMILPIIIYGIIFISPLITIIFFWLSSRDIKDIDSKKFNTVIGSLSPDVKNQIIDNIQGLNKKLKQKLRLE